LIKIQTVIDNNQRPPKKTLLFVDRRKRPRPDKPGAIGFDDLGNAQYQWQDKRMLDDSDAAESRRLRALSLANLVLVDDEPPPDITIAPLNKHGMRLGYNPYESGRLEKTQRNKQIDLRALSDWIASRNNPPKNKD
jgi:hypothetical protein